ncbi:MAG TPA: DJ-1/PfpI family protein [Thermoanaerobaculia bacterium]|nr:DJ-1/PfpI family protein [Thermoanaerobaculia bacterium]
MHISMILFDRMTQLDLGAPYEVFIRMPDTTVELVAKSRDAVVADGGFAIVPQATFADARPADLLFVPGGFGVNDAMLDTELIAFVRKQAERAQWITSVCSGSLILGAAGLLRGYEATTHWASVDMLARFGARPVGKRVVRDRNRITAGGVTSGTDFALTVAAELYGEPLAKTIQLAIEYDPQPPFNSGSPRVADDATLATVRQRLEKSLAARREAIEIAVARMPE